LYLLHLKVKILYKNVYMSQDIDFQMLANSTLLTVNCLQLTDLRIE
jgi:hypothetical protein